METSSSRIQSLILLVNPGLKSNCPLIVWTLYWHCSFHLRETQNILQTSIQHTQGTILLLLKRNNLRAQRRLKHTAPHSKLGWMSAHTYYESCSSKKKLLLNEQQAIFFSVYRSYAYTYLISTNTWV